MKRKTQVQIKQKLQKERKINDESMEKNPFQHTHQYPWAKINKTEIIPQYPNYTMVIDNGEGDRDIHRTWEKITELPSNGFCNEQRNDFQPTLCFDLDHWRPRFDGVMQCERKWREGSEKGEKFWLKYFEGSEKE